MDRQCENSVGGGGGGGEEGGRVGGGGWRGGWEGNIKIDNKAHSILTDIYHVSSRIKGLT